MAGLPGTTFDHIIAIFETVVKDATILRREADTQRAILLLKGIYHNHQVYLREISRADGSRKYSYYVIREGQVLAGFDNAADPRALRLKYAQDYVKHREEPIPHFHSANRQVVELTHEMNCEMFIEWLKQNL